MNQIKKNKERNIKNNIKISENSTIDYCNDSNDLDEFSPMTKKNIDIKFNEDDYCKDIMSKAFKQSKTNFNSCENKAIKPMPNSIKNNNIVLVNKNKERSLINKLPTFNAKNNHMIMSYGSNRSKKIYMI
jgi:hypothetical protein